MAENKRLEEESSDVRFPNWNRPSGISPARSVFSHVFLWKWYGENRLQGVHYLRRHFAAFLFIFCPAEGMVRKGKGITMTMRLLVIVALFSLVIALALPPMAAADAAADYKAKCAMCHGADGMGKAAMGTKDLGSADIQKMSDADLTGAITNGKGKMPAYKGKLTDAQVSDLVKYIRTLKK
jgi:cytochrome c6